MSSIGAELPKKFTRPDFFSRNFDNFFGQGGNFFYYEDLLFTLYFILVNK